MASTTKSRGATLTVVSRGRPTIGSTASFGCRSSHWMTKYGPSNFWVVPSRLSPTTIEGR